MQMMQVGTIGNCGGGNMGWQSYPFLVTPKELGMAFEPFKLVVINFRKFCPSDADYYGLSSEKGFQTYPDYELFKKSIANITKPLTFRQNGIVKKTTIRISDEAKTYLPNFTCIKSQGIEIL